MCEEDIMNIVIGILAVFMIVYSLYGIITKIFEIKNISGLFQNFRTEGSRFWKNFLGFIGKICFKNDFSGAFFETNRVLEKARSS